MVTRRWLLGAACAAILIAILAARPLPTPGPLARDFEAYWSAGAAQNAGADPYGRAIWSDERRVPGVVASHDELLPFVGPPATLWAWVLAARWPYDAAARGWWVLLAVSLLALVAVVLRGAGVAVTASDFTAGTLLAIAFAPISSDLALGQLALPTFLGACAVPVLADRSLAAAFACACLAFAQPNAALGLVSQLGRNRSTLALLLATLATYALGALAAGWAWPIAYAHVLVAHGAAERFVAIQFSPVAIAYGFGARAAAAIVIGVAIALIAIAACIAIAFRVRDRFARFAAFSALVPFVAGFVHEHDLVTAFGAALWCARRTGGATRTLALTGTLLAGVDWLGLAQRPTGVVQSLLLAVAAFVAFVALGGPAGYRGAAPAGVAVAALFTALAFLAVSHPMPVWPDSLANFRAALGAPPAAVWLAEQRANGLLAAVPAWSLLRSASLLGCAVLALAIYRHSACYRTA
ncbi:MAG: hypothetical protein JO190_02880 [Candidatus Eremiobacteraeota bacterium]|nr:hypothetical protein [Candidatus Eremiobacteraeota bacterium]